MSDPERDVRERPDGGADVVFDVQGNDEPDASADLDVECVDDIDCFDENPCTNDLCESGSCVYTPNNSPPNQIVGNCRAESCFDGQLLLETDDSDVPPNDGFECTEYTCVAGSLQVTADDALCDDGDRCNGLELCDVEVGCREGLPADFDEDGEPDITQENDAPDADGDGITDCADWETCDGIDNDHNGLVDDNPLDESLGESCYDGAASTDGVGACTPGVLVCRGGAIVCADQTVPADDEYCDGLDNDCDGEVPQDEIDAFCRQSLTLPSEAAGPELMLVEVSSALRAVDVHFNIDTTGSMAGALETLRDSLQTDIVPGVAEVFPDAAFGVSTFEDFPITNFGASNDLPFELWQRITTDVSQVQEALSRVNLGSGVDEDESGIESLYQIATGAGTRWPRTGGTTVDPSLLTGWIGEIDPIDEPYDFDYYQIDLPPTTFVSVDVYATRVGSGLDAVIEIYDAEGTLIRRNNNRDDGGSDPLVATTLTGPAPYFLKIQSFSNGTTGWYYATVQYDTSDYLVPRVSACSELEVGGDYFAGTGGAVELVHVDEATPRSAYGPCFEDCIVAIPDINARNWVRSYCFAGGTPTCGNGVLDDFEECDDNNSNSRDGCSSICGIEADGVTPFNSETRFDPALGHGTRGGVGFREQAFPIIVHATDAGSHDQADYHARDTDILAHGTEETFLELEKLGARIVGIAGDEPADAMISDPLNPPGMSFRTGALVPPCAFDGSEPRTRDVGDFCDNDRDCFSRDCLGGRCQPACEPGECCVGIRGAGRAPEPEANGMCPLTFEMDGAGGGLTDGVIRGIQALARFATYNVSPVFLDDPSNPRDARCFVQSVEVSEVILDDECVPELVFSDRDGDGTLESIDNATPQSRVVYAITVENRDSRDFDGDLDTQEACGPPGTYHLTLEVRGDDVVVLSTAELEIVVTE